MTDLRKAAEMALEALEGALSDDQPYIEKSKKAAEALRQALAQPEQEPVAWADKVGAVIPHSHKLFQPDLLKDYTRPLYTAPVDAVNMSQERVDETAKREHEPVGYIDGMHGGYMVFTPINPSAVYLNGTALYTAPLKREVWCDCGDGIMPGSGAKCGNCIAAESAAREWVGLTDEDLSVCDADGVLLAKYWEAKLKEKNSG